MTQQRLIVLFDGTWNDPDDQTNVYRFSQLIHSHDGDIAQHAFYDPGVGTSKWQRFRGGIFGYGLSKNLRQGYEYIAKRYQDGDEIWILGFSRGAYTARSLVGLIRKCGLVHQPSSQLLDQAEKLYRDKRAHPDGERCTAFRQQHSCEPRIHFIGVWDTVGSLGIPGTFLSEHGKYAWHDTELSSIVDRAYHAVALDEHRAAYKTALWTSKTGNQKERNLDVQQRWFIGAHANVGGGYPNDPLADLPMNWLHQQAVDAGLKLDAFTPADRAWATKPVDSFKEFLGGIYAWFKKLFRKGDGRHHRAFALGHNDRPGVNISVDDSVWQRWNEIADYRPRTLTAAGQQPPQAPHAVEQAAAGAAPSQESELAPISSPA